MEQKIGFELPVIVFPCGENIQMSLESLATLKSAGTEELYIAECYRCREEHTLPLPDCRTLTAKITPIIATATFSNR